MRAKRIKAGLNAEGGAVEHVWRAETEAKLVSALLDPTTKHYNGQGAVLPSTCLPLHSGDFEGQWRKLWDLHVNFGTSKSHKKLAKKAEKRAMADDAAQYMQKPVVNPASLAQPPQKRAAANAAISGLVDAQRKRNFSQTKAAMLLSGVGASAS
jgi:hypothetical protein